MSQKKLEKFTAGDSVYGPCGEAYTYHEATGDGKHYVYEIIRVQTTSYSGDDFEEHEEEGQLLIRDTLYAKAPIQVFDEDFTIKKRELLRLEREVSDTQTQLRTLQGDISSHKKSLEYELSRYPNHDAIIKLLNSELLVFKILEDSYVIKSCDDSDYMCSFNFRNGNIELPPRHKFRSDSYKSRAFYDKITAVEFYKTLLSKIDDPTRLDECDLHEIITSCSLISINVPNLIKVKYDKIQADKKIKQKVEIDKKITKLQNQLHELNSSNTVKL